MGITFIESMAPALEPGEYVLSMTQALLNTKPTGQNDTINESHTATRRLVVRGQRLKLAPGAVHACFPPARSQASYDAVLPHIVLSSITLPWERQVGADNGSCPWLALLLFDASDPPPSLQTISPTALEPDSLPANTVSYPEFRLEHGETATDRCDVLDVPVGLFAQLAPTLKDFSWLGHGRQNADGETFAVLVGNRMLTTGGAATVHLVSLEGMAAYLPTGLPGAPRVALLDGSHAEFIRVISLFSWSFTSLDPNQSFEGALTHLNVGPLQRISKQEAMSDTFGLGYTAMNHHTRQGATTVSWYRGPFLPITPVASEGAFGDSPPPFDRSDELVRYDPTTGMFDVSYAAAWELGRLLALQSKTFSSALHTWRRTLVRAAAEEALRAGGAALEQTRMLLADRERLARIHDQLPPPDAVVQWLARLRQLYGVPFNYLVPDECMLPTDAIRFFCLDDRWIDALVDGATSVGRAASADAAHDALAVPRLLALSRAAAQQDLPVSGFLLRSTVAAGWPGMSVTAYDDHGSVLPALRQEQLAPSILLLLASGVLAKIELQEPAQTLHFGVDDVGGGQFTKGSRWVTVPLSAPTGTRPGMATKRPALEVQVEDGRVGIDDLAGLLKGDLVTIHGNNDQNDHPRGFGAAEFALQMVEGAESVAFVNRPGTPSS